VACAFPHVAGHVALGVVSSTSASLLRINLGQ